jgi:hypothetical protein
MVRVSLPVAGRGRRDARGIRVASFGQRRLAATPP